MELTGHSGAAALAAPNTPEGFRAAAAAGAGRIEFDVYGLDGAPILAHDAGAAAGALSLDDGLRVLTALGLPLACDVKGSGAEEAIAAALQRHGVVERTIVCGHDLDVLARIRARLPGATIGWSVPQPDDVPRPQVPWPPERAVALGWRERLIPLAVQVVRRGDCDGLMVQHLLVTAGLVRAVHVAGGFVRAWTVDAEETALRMRDCRVDGLTTNDPARIAAALAGAARPAA